MGEVAVQEQVLGPGEQVDRGEGELQPGGVDGELAGREVAEAGVFAAAESDRCPWYLPVVQLSSVAKLRVLVLFVTMQKPDSACRRIGALCHGEVSNLRHRRDGGRSCVDRIAGGVRSGPARAVERRGTRMVGSTRTMCRRSIWKPMCSRLMASPTAAYQTPFHR